MTWTKVNEHSDKVEIIGRFLYDKLKVDKKRWGMELAIFNRLETLGFEDKKFWMTLDLGYEFNSFAHLQKDNCKMIKAKYLNYLKKKQAEEIFEFSVKHRL